MLIIARTDRFRVSETHQFYSDIATICKQSNPETLNIKKPFNAFVQAHKQSEGSFKKKQKSDLTTTLNQLDQRRDKALVCINVVAGGYLSHFDGVKQKAAENIVNCFKKYGNRIYDMNRQAETGVVSSLGSDLTGSLAADVQTIGLTDVASELVESNMAYSKTDISRIGEQASDDDESTSELLADTTRAYRTLYKHINANEVLHPSDALTILINKLNILIERYNRIADMRAVQFTEQTEAQLMS